MNFKLVSLRLGRLYDVLWARDANEAVQLLASYGPELHAILMDIELQGSALDGMSLTSAIRGIGPRPAIASAMPDAGALAEVPIIFVTGYEGQYRDSDVAAVGGDAMLGKPIDFAALEATIARLGRTSDRPDPDE